MGQWLDALRAAKQETGNLLDNWASDIKTPVQLVQKVQLIHENPINCTKCTKCTASYINRTDGNHPRDWAEGYEKLISGQRPHTITALRWQQFIQDATTFMCCWSGKAHALGWTTLEVFGVHPLAPVHRPDAAGLVWLLDGNEIAALTADKAIIKTMTGNTKTMVRGVTGSVAIWETETKE